MLAHANVLIGLELEVQTSEGLRRGECGLEVHSSRGVPLLAHVRLGDLRTLLRHTCTSIVMWLCAFSVLLDAHSCGWAPSYGIST